MSIKVVIVITCVIIRRLLPGWGRDPPATCRPCRNMGRGGRPAASPPPPPPRRGGGVVASMSILDVYLRRAVQTAVRLWRASYGMARAFRRPSGALLGSMQMGGWRRGQERAPCTTVNLARRSTTALTGTFRSLAFCACW